MRELGVSVLATTRKQFLLFKAKTNFFIYYTLNAEFEGTKMCFLHYFSSIRVTVEKDSSENC